MAGPALWPLAITTGGAVVAGLGGAWLATSGAARNEANRTRKARAEAVAAERHRLEQANLLDLQLALAELVEQTQVLTANLIAKGSVAKVASEFRFQWIATKRHAAVLAERVLDDELRGAIGTVIEQLADAALPAETTPALFQQAVAAAVAATDQAQRELGSRVRTYLAGPG